jgi:HEAT repeat protein
VADALRSWAASAAPDAVSALALALAAAHPPSDALASEIATAAIAHADGFTARWRLARALALLPDDADGDTWLASTAHGSDEWMLRDAALTAVVARAAPSSADVARTALADAYPRVRVTALRALATSNEERDIVSLATLARRDTWPMVRTAAIQALAPKPRALPILRAALADVNEGVRAAAIVSLTTVRDRQAFPQIEARLRDDEEWPTVETAAIAYVDALCIAEAGDALLAVIHRAIKPAPYEPDVEAAALALMTAARLGGPTAQQALDLASRSGAPEGLHAAAAEVRAHPPARCAPSAPP